MIKSWLLSLPVDYLGEVVLLDHSSEYGIHQEEEAGPLWILQTTHIMQLRPQQANGATIHNQTSMKRFIVSVSGKSPHLLSAEAISIKP